MLQKINQIGFVKGFRQTSRTNDIVNFYKNTYILSKDKVDNSDMLRYPGFMFTDEAAAKEYYNQFYQYVEDVLTPPRGNLSADCEYVFIGIKPGALRPNQVTDDVLEEKAWLFGPSSYVLNEILSLESVYPYFTNVYKEYNQIENKNVDQICEELKIIKRLCPNVIPVFLGKFHEYDLIIRKVDIDSYIKIWHPSYVVRTGKINDYRSMFSDQIKKNKTIS